jgi:hypothetical protein
MLLFLAAIYAPTADLLVRDDEVRGPAPEFRNPAPKPGWPSTPEELYKFPAHYEAHFGDTFGLRDKLLRWNSYEKYFRLGTSPTKSQVVGRDGWFFYTGDNSMEIIRGAFALSEQELADWQTELEERSKMHAAAGRHYLFILIPNKETVYPERLPDSIRPTGPTRMDQFFAWMREHSSVDVLDLRPAFLAAKAGDTGPMDPLYTPYGTHWASRGVYTAYAAIVGHLTQGTTYAGPRPFSDYFIVPLPDGADSCAGNLYLSGLLVQPGGSLFLRTPDTFTVLEQKGSSPQWLRTRGKGTNLLPHTIIFHDSFGPFISTTLAPAFETLDMSEGHVDRTRIDAHKTKIVIEMFVERYLRTHAPITLPEAPLPGDGEQVEPPEHTLFDLVATPAAARAVEGLVLTRTPDGAFRLARGGARDGLVLGPLPGQMRGEVRLRIDFEADSPATLDVMWRLTKDPGFTRIARTQLPVGPGRDTRDVQLPRLDGEWELMLRPTNMAPDVVVHALTIRTVDSP